MSFFLCDRICTQSKKLKEDIMVAFDLESVGWKKLNHFLRIDEKTLRNLLHLIRISVQCI